MVRVNASFIAKGCREILGILAWSWAICLFVVGFLGGEIEDDQPPILRQLFVPCLKILVIAPSAIYALPQGSPSSSEVRPGSAGHHGNVQAGAFPFPQFRPSTRDSSSSSSLSGMPVAGIQVPYANSDADPATSQHMSINNDGRYSFSYSAGNSAREERREPDGSVKGKYSYIDPLGKLVEVEYTADSASGFNAYGENVPPRTVSYAPYPVQDTPDVAAARAKFLAYYQQEWNARKELEAIENATATPSPSLSENGNGNGESSDSGSVQLLSSSQAPQAFDNGNGNGNRIPVKQQVEDDEDDTEVVNRDESVADSDIVSLGNNNNNKNVAPSGLLQPLPLSTVSAAPSSNNNNNNNGVGDGASYSLNFDVGNFHNQFQSHSQNQPQPQQQQQPQIQTYQTGTKSGPGSGSGFGSATVQSVQGPGYFYYMTSGGLPFYVTSLPTRTNVAVSVRASQLGAIPAAAMHDVQTPHYGGGVYRPKQTPAVYVEVGQDYNELGQTPAGTVTPQHFRQYQQQQQQQGNSGVQVPRYPTNFPFFGYPVYVY